jgi:hypothetical protein
VAFAQMFQEAFAAKSLVLGTGVAWGADRPAEDQQLWVVRFGSNAIQVTLDGPPSYFAPRPLSNALVSEDGIGVRSFDPTDGTLSADDASRVSASSVDLDARMAAFLDAVEGFLAPAIAVPASVANPDAFALCLAQKRCIANRLVTLVTELTTGEAYETFVQPGDPCSPSAPAAPPAMAAAVEKLRQECLISLSNFYQIDAVVAHPLQATFGAGAVSPDLPLRVDAPDLQAYLGSLATAIQSWATTNQPAGLLAGDPAAGLLTLDVTLFTDASRGGAPFLRLRNLFLQAANINWG